VKCNIKANKSSPNSEEPIRFEMNNSAYLTIDIAKYQNEEIKSKQTSHSLPIHTN
jgi:hypothetical protein